MEKQLAIKGHATRGKEVIELLVMMGGKSKMPIDIIREDYDYIISEKGSILPIPHYNIEFYNCVIFTLEEFLDKFPYKVGDKIPDVWGNSCTVKSMSWDENYKTVMYGFEETIFVVRGDELKVVNEIKPLFKAGDVVKLKGCPDKNLFWIVMDVVKDGYIFNDAKKIPFDEQHHYEKSNREVLLTTPKTPSKMKNVLVELLDHIKTTPKEELEREFEEIKEWTNVGPTVEEFMTFCESVNKKLVYPKTYDECCKNVLGLIHWGMTVDVPMHYSPLIINFTKLLICRDAYWKIAGEEMGLDKPWEPDWSDIHNDVYGIQLVTDDTNAIYHESASFTFPTEEMRDIFYENFKDLIEQCKELL